MLSATTAVLVCLSNLAPPGVQLPTLATQFPLYALITTTALLANVCVPVVIPGAPRRELASLFPIVVPLTTIVETA